MAENVYKVLELIGTGTEFLGASSQCSSRTSSGNAS